MDQRFNSVIAIETIPQAKRWIFYRIYIISAACTDINQTNNTNHTELYNVCITDYIMQ